MAILRTILRSLLRFLRIPLDTCCLEHRLCHHPGEKDCLAVYTKRNGEFNLEVQFCTRPEGHSGPHVACKRWFGDDFHNAKVWD